MGRERRCDRRPRSGRICFWSRSRLPEIELLFLEHEAAHTFHPSGGAPDPAAWEEAVEADGRAGESRYVNPRIEAHYLPEEYLGEDWASSVSMLLEDDRAHRTSFRDRYAHRAEVIRQVLAS